MTKKEPKAKRMGEIIQAAVDEFLEKGYEAASMDTIAKRAGISKGGLYHHFRSKDEILLYANQKLNEPIADIRHRAAQKASAADSLNWYIRSYMEHWCGRKRELVFYSLSMAKMLDSPELSRMYENYIEHDIEYLHKLYEKGISSGELISHPARDSALLLQAALDGIAMHLIISGSLNLESVISLFQSKFVNAYRKNNAVNRIIE
jgi:AcrR family transcriptional regulator